MINFPSWTALRRSCRARPYLSCLGNAAVNYHAQRFSIPNGHRLRVHAATANRVGEVLGAAAVLRVLNGFRSSYQVLHDRAVTMSGLRGRNVLMFGDPTLAPLVAADLERGVFVTNGGYLGKHGPKLRTHPFANPEEPAQRQLFAAPPRGSVAGLRETGSNLRASSRRSELP